MAHLSLVSVQNTDHNMLIPLLLPTLALIDEWKLLRAASQHPIHLCFLRACHDSQTLGIDIHRQLPRIQAWLIHTRIFY